MKAIGKVKSIGTLGLYKDGQFVRFERWTWDIKLVFGTQTFANVRAARGYLSPAAARRACKRTLKRLANGSCDTILK